MILVFSWPEDDHAVAVLERLRARGAEAAVVDLSRFPADGAFSASYAAGEADRAPGLLELSGRAIPLGEVRAVWWRRARQLALPPGVSPAHQAFAIRECWEALLGAWLSMDARWVNRPERDEDAAHKPWQLALAERLGLPLPPTLVTSDPARAAAFVAARGERRCVYKALGTSPETWSVTRFVAPGADLADVRLAPVIFQEYVEGVDVRVTLVGDRVFATEIDARATRSPHDFRPVFDEADVRAVELPPDVEQGLRRLVAELGLSFATLDLRRTPAGEHLFLEVNPAGQWLFVEQRTGQPIAAALAELLASGKST